MLDFKPEEKFMKIAIREAKKAYARGDYPIGACIAKGNQVVAFGGNRVKTKADSTRHVELELIQYAVGSQIGHYLEDCVLYSTHEPCPMCSGAAVWSRIGGVVYGCTIPDFKKFTDVKKRLKWRIIDVSCKKIVKGKNIKVVGGFMQAECNKLFGLEHK
jgi:tRNA(Arg) A34 adenosine deaminase TadA